MAAHRIWKQGSSFLFGYFYHDPSLVTFLGEEIHSKKDNLIPEYLPRSFRSTLGVLSDLGLGDFWKSLATNFLIKLAQKIGNFLGYFKVCRFLRKTNLVTFWASIGKFGLLLIPITGHTAREPKNPSLSRFTANERFSAHLYALGYQERLKKFYLTLHLTWRSRCWRQCSSGPSWLASPSPPAPWTPSRWRQQSPSRTFFPVQVQSRVPIPAPMLRPLRPRPHRRRRRPVLRRVSAASGIAWSAISGASRCRQIRSPLSGLQFRSPEDREGFSRTRWRSGWSHVSCRDPRWSPCLWSANLEEILFCLNCLYFFSDRLGVELYLVFSRRSWKLLSAQDHSLFG